MKTEQKYNIYVATKAAKILYAQACKGAELRSARLKSGELAVMVYLNISPAQPCDAYGCGATHTCEECGYESEASAIANVERHSELVEDLYYIGEMLYEEGIYEKGFARLHDDFAIGAYGCLLLHIAQG